MAYTTSQIYSDLGKTSENNDNDIISNGMKFLVRRSFDIQVRRQFINGFISFIFNLDNQILYKYFYYLYHILMNIDL